MDSDDAKTDASSSAVPDNKSNLLSSYQPTQMETLAAHIYGFVSSASALSSSLSASSQSPSLTTSRGVGDNDEADEEEEEKPKLMNGSGDAPAGINGVAEDDEVKLLRMRTKKHEIVVVPNRKYLLCVVHGTTPASDNVNGGKSR